MAGGIFEDKPFVLNTKCLVFSLYSSLLYYAGVRAGKVHIIIIVLIFVISYILLAWYDFAYNCETVMASGKSPAGISSIFKPQRREETADDEIHSKKADNQEDIYLQKVYFFHALIIAPLLMYVAFLGKKTQPEVFGILGGLGGLAFLYHSYRLKQPRQTSCI
jgi:hypothetical protein